MHSLRLLCISIGLSTFSSYGVFAQGRSVAITVDDLPYAGNDIAASNRAEVQATAETVNRKLLAALRRHHVPVTGFVIQKRVESLGPATGVRILKEWPHRGFDLANHTYSHPDINSLSTDESEQEIARGEATIKPLMKEAGKKLAFFRFPMNHTGDTQEKHDAIAAF